MEFTATYICVYSTTSQPLYCRLITESSDPGKGLQAGFIKTITYYSLIILFFMHAPIIQNNVRVPRTETGTLGVRLAMRGLERGARE